MQKIEVDQQVINALAEKAVGLGFAFHPNGPNLTLRHLLGLDMAPQTSSPGDEIEIPFQESNRKYKRILIPKEARWFFPGFQVPFSIITDIGSSEAHIGGAPRGNKGDLDAGRRLRGRLGPWIERHSELTSGDILIIKAIEPNKRYQMSIKP